MGLKQVVYSYLVPELIWQKFHENVKSDSKTKKITPKPAVHACAPCVHWPVAHQQLLQLQKFQTGGNVKRDSEIREGWKVTYFGFEIAPLVKIPKGGNVKSDSKTKKLNS